MSRPPVDEKDEAGTEITDANDDDKRRTRNYDEKGISNADKPEHQHDIEAQRALDDSIGRIGPDNISVRSDSSDPADAYIVSWDSEVDPANPLNWSPVRRWTLIFLVSAVTFLASASSSMFAPAVPAVMADFGSTNTTLGSFVLTVFLLGLGGGPLFWAPLSEIYGRLPVQHAGSVGFLAFTIMCAESKSMAMLVVARLLQGTFASMSLTNGGGIVADTIKQEERGFAFSFYTMGILVGPSVGPVVGGFLSEAKGWRWVFWLIAIVVSLFCATWRWPAKSA